MSAAFFRKMLRNLALAFPLAGLALPLTQAERALAQEAQSSAYKKAEKVKKPARREALEISGAWAREMMPAAKVGAGYFEIKNNSDKAMRLSAVHSNIAKKVEIHSMIMEGNIMKMRRLPDGIEIPPHSGLSFKPGSYHLMFISPKAPFKAGQIFKTRFSFEGGSEIEVPFTVRAAVKAASGKTAHEVNMKMGGAHQAK